MLALVSTGTLAVCGVKAPPRPPLAESVADAGAATFAECSPEAREAFATARFACGDEARMLPGCKVSCTTDAGAADEEREENSDAGSDAGGARPDERAPPRDGGSR